MPSRWPGPRGHSPTGSAPPGPNRWGPPGYSPGSPSIYCVPACSGVAVAVCPGSGPFGPGPLRFLPLSGLLLWSASGGGGPAPPGLRLRPPALPRPLPCPRSAAASPVGSALLRLGRGLGLPRSGLLLWSALAGGGPPRCAPCARLRSARGACGPVPPRPLVAAGGGGPLWRVAPPSPGWQPPAGGCPCRGLLLLAVGCAALAAFGGPLRSASLGLPACGLAPRSRRRC